MAWNAPFDYTPAQVLTAANLDTYLSGNMNETAVAKVTTAGDLVYATAANALARLGIGAVGTFLNSSGSAPQWGKITAALLNVGYDRVATSQTTTSTSYADLATAGPSVAVTCPSGAAILLFFAIVANASINERATFGVRIDAVDPTADMEATWDNADDATAPNASLVGIAYASGLSVASHTFKLRYKTTGGTQYFRERRLIVVGL